MRLLCIIVNFRTADHTIAAVESLLRDTQGMDAHVTVVDNDSGDGSIEVLERAAAERGWDRRVDLIASDHNGGFGAGNNIAIRRALSAPAPPDFFFLVNPDALAEPGAARALLAVFRDNPRVGIAGGCIRGFDGSRHVSAFRFPTPVGELEAGLRLGIATRVLRRWAVAAELPQRSGPADWVSGAAMMLRRDVLDSVGLFDESFFLFYEETDLCLRAHRAGWATWYAHESHIRHAGAAATGLRENGRRVPPYWYASRIHYFRKNHGKGHLWGANALFALGYAVWRVRRRLQRKPDVDPPHLLMDFLRYNLLPARRSGTR